MTPVSTSESDVLARIHLRASEICVVLLYTVGLGDNGKIIKLYVYDDNMDKLSR